jgi:hypothetical protein
MKSCAERSVTDKGVRGSDLLSCNDISTVHVLNGLLIYLRRCASKKASDLFWAKICHLKACRRGIKL